jgi:hypothetical protein
MVGWLDVTLHGCATLHGYARTHAFVQRWVNTCWLDYSFLPDLVGVTAWLFTDVITWVGFVRGWWLHRLPGLSWFPAVGYGSNALRFVRRCTLGSRFPGRPQLFPLRFNTITVARTAHRVRTVPILPGPVAARRTRGWFGPVYQLPHTFYTLTPGWTHTTPLVVHVHLTVAIYCTPRYSWLFSTVGWLVTHLVSFGYR